MFVIFYHGKNMFNEAASVVSAFHCPTYISLNYITCIPFIYHKTNPFPTSSTFQNISCFHRKRNSIHIFVFFPIGSNLHQHFLCFFVKTCNNLHWSYGSKPLISHDWSTYALPQRTPLGNKGLIRRLVRETSGFSQGFNKARISGVVGPRW